MNEVTSHRIKRHRRVRKKISGSTDRPRVAVFRSNKYLYAQVIDDLSGKTIVAASSQEPELRQSAKGNSKDVASKVGTLLAERAIEKGIRSVVFDRGGYKFHGKVKAFADGAREKGLEF